MTSETVTYGAAKIGGLSTKSLAGWLAKRAKALRPKKRPGVTQGRGARLAHHLTRLRGIGAFGK
jgi:hypothetical protein